tara:strand:- start:1551 stop:1991 length:441 start_codon:yes stop_codon:yes gene_type:complete
MTNSEYIYFEEVSKRVDPDQANFLFELLKNKKFPISHQMMPTFEEHLNFIANHPYYKWFLIILEKRKIGSIYINKDNSVSLQILDDRKYLAELIIKRFEESFLPQTPIKSLRASNFFFNLHPDDKFMKKVLHNNGYHLSQVSFSKT